MSITLQIGVIVCALVIVMSSGAAAIALSIKIPDPSDDLREGIKNLYWIASFGAAALIGMAASMG